MDIVLEHRFHPGAVSDFKNSVKPVRSRLVRAEVLVHLLWQARRASIGLPPNPVGVAGAIRGSNPRVGPGPLASDANDKKD